MYLGQIVEEAPTQRLLADAAHPYSQALLAASPAADDSTRSRSAPPLEGELPSPLAPPPGCRFHPRCPKAHAVCRTQPPPWKDMAPDWRVRCHLPCNA